MGSGQPILHDKAADALEGLVGSHDRQPQSIGMSSDPEVVVPHRSPGGLELGPEAAEDATEEPAMRQGSPQLVREVKGTCFGVPVAQL